MRTEPQRKDRTMETTQEMESLLERMPVGYLTLTTKNGPYVVPVNYLFSEGSIYFHSGMKGRKMEALQVDSHVCFLVDDIGPQVLYERGCGISQIYESVICFGRTEFVDGLVEKSRILEKMIQKFVPTDHRFVPMQVQNIEKTAVVRIRIEWMTGKAHRVGPLHTILPNRFLNTKKW